MRRKAKIDSNHGEIVSALRKLGFSVLSLAAVGKGCPDLVLGKHGRNYLVEVKDGDKCPSARKLTDDQQKFYQNWLGQYRVISSVEEAVDWANNL